MKKNYKLRRSRYDKYSTPNTQQYKVPVTASIHQQIIERIENIQGKSHNFTGTLEVRL